VLHVVYIQHENMSPKAKPQAGEKLWLVLMWLKWFCHWNGAKIGYYLWVWTCERGLV